MRFDKSHESYIQSQAKAGTKARWFYDSRIINWAKDAISEIGSYENFFALASETLSGCNGLKFYFSNR